ncbi:MAG: glycerophosphodiester phosphodiesterase [Devosia sp.]|uniref:glycerophosphodiester phosphodiesterase family protein n=1 Tax=Devosia sp. TaxID=1871048 RepID=UPI001ACA6733|nr:glycerophosphodiester phosphodiesterase family protein [Devosia sp.]MBN9314306.1 glycerophosphodiester phosphodiesterase [Devosia sp.]
MCAKPNFDRPIAHRGLHDSGRGIIENTASAFAAAIEKGYAIECDVQLSRDGIPMIFHDDDLDRLTGVAGPVGARTMAELASFTLLGSAAGDTPQRFTEFLAQVAGRTLLQIELKQQPNRAATEVLAQTVMDALKGYRGPVTIESFDPNLLVEVRKRGATMPLGIVTYAYDEPEWDQNLSGFQRVVLRHLLHYPITRFDFISCRDKSLGLPAVRLFRALGVPVTTWTIKTPAAAMAVIGKADQIVFEGFEPPSA